MDPIALYIQQMHSSLQGGGAVKVSTFVDDHIASQPILHPLARQPEPDLSALIYSTLRLPAELLHSDTVLLGQSDKVFERSQFPVADAAWQSVAAVARSRKCRWQSNNRQLAMFIASISDVEDIVTNVTALYIELQKLQAQITGGTSFDDCFIPEDLARLKEVLGSSFEAFVELANAPIDWEIRLLAGSDVDYAQAVQAWWINIAASRKVSASNVYNQPVYFVSSNSHSLINVLSGFPLKERERLLHDNQDRMMAEAEAFAQAQVPEENILYYLSRFSEKKFPDYIKQKIAYEKTYGLTRVPPYHHIDIEAQIFSIRDVLNNPHLDPRLTITPAMKTVLLESNALIINIAYPLGMAAYRILKEVSENVSEMRGVYIMGKAASLNASIGDISIPHSVHDRHTSNELFVYNDFTAKNFSPFLNKQSILDAQKAVTVRGTYLQNEQSLSQDFDRGFTIVEMEAGPYLERIYEMMYPTRYPEHASIMINTPFRLGLAYYISDTPHRTGHNLGSKRLTWEGLNATYAISLGIVQDILTTEVERYS